MATVVYLRPLLFTLILFSTILTAIALFTPGWRGEMGLVTNNCGGAGCGPWWDNQPGWYQTVIVLMVVAFIVELIILTWAALSWVGICGPSLNYPLGVLCGIAAVLLVASVATFAAGNPREIVGVSRGFLGYSYWIAVIATILMVLTTFVACGVAGVISKM